MYIYIFKYPSQYYYYNERNTSAVEEERRLFFVAATRAKKNLTMIGRDCSLADEILMALGKKTMNASII